jgi:predicted Zn-dependent peptidase
MEIIRKQINEVPVTIIKTNKFKTIAGILKFKSPVTKENLIKRSFLKRILVYTTNKYKTNKELNIRCLEDYDASFSSSIRRDGIYVNNILVFDSLEDAYTEENNLNNVIDTFLEIVFNPNVKDGAFDKESFDYAYNKIKRSYEKIEEDPRNFLAHDILNYLNQNKAYSYDMDLEILSKITPEDLYLEYKEMIENSEISLYLVGNIDENDKCFEKITDKIKSNKVFDKPLIISNDDEDLKEENIVNSIKGNQSILEVLCYMRGLTGFETNYVMPIYRTILGGGGSSRLFNNVREKNSLAYYCFARSSKDDNILEIITGIEKQNKDKALEIIKQELKNMNNVTEEEVELAKKDIISSYIESQDNILNVLTSQIQRDIYNLGSSTDMIENIKKVTKEDVEKLNDKIKYKLNYFLEGSDING